MSFSAVRAPYRTDSPTTRRSGGAAPLKQLHDLDHGGLAVRHLEDGVALLGLTVCLEAEIAEDRALDRLAADRFRHGFAIEALGGVGG
jgi:hypothetical protein